MHPFQILGAKTESWPKITSSASSSVRRGVLRNNNWEDEQEEKMILSLGYRSATFPGPHVLRTPPQRAPGTQKSWTSP